MTTLLHPGVAFSSATCYSVSLITTGTSKAVNTRYTGNKLVSGDVYSPSLTALTSATKVRCQGVEPIDRSTRILSPVFTQYWG